MGSRLWSFGSRDVIGHMTTGFPRCGFLLIVNVNRPCISHDCWDIELQRYRGHDLDLLGSRDVICHVTMIRNMGFPIGGQFQPTVYLAQFLRYSASNVLGSRLWPFGSRDVIGMTTGYPRCRLTHQYENYEPTVYLARLSRYWASNISGSRLWHFEVTWRRLSRDHWIRNMWFPIDGQLEPTAYLAQFLRY